MLQLEQDGTVRIKKTDITQKISAVPSVTDREHHPENGGSKAAGQRAGTEICYWPPLEIMSD